MKFKWLNYKLDLSNDDFVSYRSNGDLSLISSQPQNPIVFLNGLSCTDQHFEKMMSFMHKKNIPFISLDYRGHFSSSKMSIERIDVESIASDVSSIIKKHKLKNVTLIGHSMGANIGIKVAIKEKRTVKKIVCIAGPASEVADSLFHSNFTDYILPFFEKYQNSYPLIQNILWKKAQNIWVEKIVYHLGFNTKKIPLEYIQKYIKDATKLDFNVFKKLFFEMMNSSILPSLAQVKQDMLFINGSSDHIVPKKQFARFKAICPHAKMITIEKGSHVPLSEFPRKVNHAVYDFLEE